MIAIERVASRADDSIRAVMARIDTGACGMAIILDDGGRLLGTITDGDIRRALLKGLTLSHPIQSVLADRPTQAKSPVTAKATTPSAELVRLMRSQHVRQIVVVDAHDRPTGLVTLDELIPYTPDRVVAVIMAGGRGRRLMPLTDELPKPMLPVGGRPMLEWVLDGLKRYGITNIRIASHYKAEIIHRYFGDGAKHGVNIQHLYESQPSGTAGALRLLENWDSTILVINGDILTWVDFGAMMKFHADQAAEITVAIRQHDFQVPYGVVEMAGPEICRLSEKPMVPYFVNAGIYLLQPSARELFFGHDALDMTEVIDRGLKRRRRVVGFPVTEYWADVGQIEDYERVQDDVEVECSGVAS